MQNVEGSIYNFLISYSFFLFLFTYLLFVSESFARFKVYNGFFL
jgi:hypothetical protein